MIVNDYIRSVFVSLSLSVLISCGGGGSSESPASPQPPVTPQPPPQDITQTYSVTVIDGYLRAATVWLDINNNGIHDSDEPTTVTQGNGKGTFTLSSDIDPTKYSVLAFAEAGKTFDESLNNVVEKDFILASPEGEQIITPLTTLVYLKSRKVFDKEEAASQVSMTLGLISQNLFEDFIVTANTEQTTLAADLVRLSLMPDSKETLLSLINDSQTFFHNVDEYLSLRTRGDNQIKVIRDSSGKLSGDTDIDGTADTEDQDIDGDGILNNQDAFPYNSAEWEDLDNDGIGNNSDIDIDNDNVENNIDIFPLNPTEWEDLDNDGIGNNSDPDIDGDGILNNLDESPYLTEFNTLQNPGVLNISQVIEGDIASGQWQYFTVESSENVMLNITLSNLSGDADLYVQQESFPTKFDYQCRSNLSNNQTEKCVDRTQQIKTYYVGVLARQDSTFHLSATVEAIVYKKAMLLLHGLASSPDTWNSMINDDSFFNGKCQILTVDNDDLIVMDANSDGISCFNLEFGAFDRVGTYSARGLDNKPCGSVQNCNGDYTTFEGLGYEVEAAVTMILEHLGQDTEIFLLGHSRGGLAARSYLQNDQAKNKAYVKGFATTGTPHQGSPLGRFYQYMHDNCIPESVYRQDGSKCEDNWEVIEMLNGTRSFFGYNYSKEYKMDLQAPSVYFLSPESLSIQNLNNNLSGLNQLIIGQLAYEGTAFGILSKGPSYDLYDYGAWLAGDHPHPDTLSYIENGQTRASFIGDGIVPAYSQKLSLLMEKQGLSVTKTGIINTSNILHTEETSQVSDINWLFEGLYLSLGWK
jgi:pimeloyl-ACP methyl ester carboxylesterase